MPVVPLFPNELAQVKYYSTSSLSPANLFKPSSNKQYPKHWLLKQCLSQNLPMPVVPLFPNELAQVKYYSTSSLSPANLFKPSSNKQYPKHWLLKQCLSQNLPMPVVPLFPNELAQVKDYSASSLSPPLACGRKWKFEPSSPEPNVSSCIFQK